MSELTDTYDVFVAAAGNAPPPLDSDQYPCSSCGSVLGFSPDAQALRCTHCGTVNEIEVSDDAEVLEQDLHSVLNGKAAKETFEIHQTAQCGNCAATFDFDPNQHAAECPFCGTGIVGESDASRLIKPHGVLPFLIDEAQAKSRVQGWLKSLWFAPNDAKKFSRESGGLSGMYTPYWTFDAQTRSSFAGQRGDTYYVTVQRGDQRVREARIRWTSVSGDTARFFDDVIVLASHSLPKRITDRLSPWDLSAVQPYQGEYIAGFRAEAYQIDLDDGLTEAEATMEQVIRSDVRQRIGGDHQRISWVRTRYSEQTFKHLLLPVWISAYRFRGKTYRYVVNGQTGRVQGERPYSIIKIAAAVLLVLLLLGAAALLYAS